MARIYDPKRAEVYERLGIPTVATVRWTADRMLRHLVPDAHTELWRDPTSTVSMVEVPVAPGLDRPAATGAGGGDRRPGSAYVMRFGIGTLPTASTVLQDGDQVFMLVTDDMIDDASRKITSSDTGREGTDHAGRDRRGRQRRPVHRRRADRQRPPGACSSSGSRAAASRTRAAGRVGACRRCEVASLQEARLETCDVVVAATGDDKVNLVVSLLAKTEFGVNRVVARVNRAENEWLFTEQWGVDVSVSKPRLMAALVEEAVTVGDLVRLMTFRQGQANLVEITLPPSAPYVGRPVRDVPMPRDSRWWRSCAASGCWCRARTTRSRPATSWSSSSRARSRTRSAPVILGADSVERTAQARAELGRRRSRLARSG